MKDYTTIVVHYDEIALKKSNRSFFEQTLVKNIQAALKGNHIEAVLRQYGRIIIELGDGTDVETVMALLGNVPGIHSFSPALKCDKYLDEMKGMLKHFEVGLQGAASFAIDVRRPDRDFPITSMECERQLGSAVYELMRQNPEFKDEQLKVDLNNAEVTIHFEIAPQAVYVYSSKVLGLGGLPVGSSGKMVCLLSGGIDSPVAAYKMMKRGSRITFVHFKNFSAHSNAVENKIEDLVKVLTKFQGDSKLYIVPFEKIQKTIIAHVPAKFRMIVYRRFMIRIAQKIAHKHKAHGLITGDSVGQVASQTLENLTCVHAVADRFVASPLIGMNKREIMDESIAIGTYDISIQPYDDCCSMFIAKHPATKSRLDEIEEFEKAIDTKQLIYEVLKEVDIKFIKGNEKSAD